MGIQLEQSLGVPGLFDLQCPSGVELAALLSLIFWFFGVERVNVWGASAEPHGAQNYSTTTTTTATTRQVYELYPNANRW